MGVGLMSFDDFLIMKGNSVKSASIKEAVEHIYTFGQRTVLSNYLWKTKDRDAFWKALYWYEKYEDIDVGLHSRLSAKRKAIKEWKRFQKMVIPIARAEPLVPELPE
tara:strand:- start:841 stop:1161 length:321 start_codon:yes stop_codon:yes gene_type:complete